VEQTDAPHEASVAQDLGRLAGVQRRMLDGAESEVLRGAGQREHRLDVGLDVVEIDSARGATPLLSSGVAKDKPR
jgi:hypothetical protein